MTAKSRGPGAIRRESRVPLVGDIVFEIGFRLRLQRHTFFFVRLRLGQLRFVQARIDAKQFVASLHVVAFIEINVRDLAGNLRFDANGLVGFNRAHRLHLDGNVALSGGRDNHRHRSASSDAAALPFFAAVGARVGRGGIAGGKRNYGQNEG